MKERESLAHARWDCNFNADQGGQCIKEACAAVLKAHGCFHIDGLGFWRDSVPAAP